MHDAATRRTGSVSCRMEAIPGSSRCRFALGTLLFAAVFLPALFTRNAPSPPSAFPPGIEHAATPDVQSSGQQSVALHREELMERLGVPVWHAHGWKGQGLKVAVLDSGFYGYRVHLGSALPKTVKVCSFRFDGNLEAKDSAHGILCAEVIHALAPEAELLLVNWEPECPDQFLAAVRWARQQGARILSCSIVMPSWSDCEGHGRIHEELARLLGSGDRADDVLFFASAGNTAQRHWSGPFEDDGNGYHVWRDAEGVPRRHNVIRPWGVERVSVELCCPIHSIYEVIVSDAATEKAVARAQSTHEGGTGSAVAAFLPQPGRDYRVRVRRPSLSPPPRAGGEKGGTGEFHLVALGGGLRHTSSVGSIPFPGDGSEVIAVGAVDAVGRRLAYSSCGLKHGPTKPDLVTTVPFPSRWRPRPFAGTSAAAPQASALAALLWSRHRDWNADHIRAELRNSARPCPSNGHTWETGHGLLRLPEPE
ncbi:MAG: S8 family serine peptidase [Gemmataceae bacterium]